MTKYTVAVAGATGYAGGEALRILAAHPAFEVTAVAGHSSIGHRLGEYQPHIPQLADLIVEDTTPAVLDGHDVIVLALPHGASGALAAQLDDDAVVVDLGADHRLERQQAWDDYYGGDFYQHWTYGMPELILGIGSDGKYVRQRDELTGAKRIAGPGCNVTATTLALQPAIAQGLVDTKSIVADLAVGIPARARTSSAPICSLRRPWGRRRRIRWAEHTGIFRRYCRISPMQPDLVRHRPICSRLRSPPFSCRCHVESWPR